MAKRKWSIALLLLIAFCFGSVGLYLARDQFSEHEIRQLVDRAYNRQRPGGGRLSGATYTPPGLPPVSISDLGKAQFLLLRRSDPQGDADLQALVYLAAGEWKKYAELANRLSNRNSGAALNNLGASFLAISEDDSTYLLKALDAFERAARVNPKDPEPLFNLVLVYRKLRFAKLAGEYFRQYSALDKESPWLRELATPPDESAILKSLELAVENKNIDEARRLFKANPELCRRTVMQYALDDQPEPLPLLRFIAGEMDRTYGDKTVSAMLAPLLAGERDVTVASRRLVRQGAQFYIDGKYEESLAAFKAAENLTHKTSSQFDRLWIDLNRLNTQIRFGKFDTVKEALARIIRISREQQFLWVKARALSVYGATVKLTPTYGEMLDLLAEADREFIHLDAPYDRIRVLYYLSVYRYFAGDQDQALRLALECLRLLDEGDAFRTSTMYSVISVILYRSGMPERALQFAQESVDQNRSGDYANGMELHAPITLAELYQSMSQPKLADKYIKMAEEALPDAPEGYDHVRFELMLGTLKAKARMEAHDYDTAESLLKRNVQLYYQQPFSAGTPLLSPSLTLLAQLYADTGRTAEAARSYTQAINVVEQDDEYLKAEASRVKFDDARRNLYDSAIDFELRNGSIEAAYGYLQRYRAKLFLEFLAAFNPSIEAGGPRLDRAQIQQKIPKDTQIVEYALLKDRLLIWVVTDRLFTLRSVPISRTELEDKIQTVLQNLRIEGDVDQLLTDLGRLLIEPVSDLLDPDRSLTIIPDRALHGIPFQSLKRASHYLVQDYAIVVSPSLTHFLAGDSVQPPRRAIVAFGSQNGGSSEITELTALRKIYPLAEMHTGKEVDKASFLQALTKAAIFHYAGHSATDAADPLRSSILLDGDRHGPNSVTAVDISQHHMSSNAVVILSSCDSAVGNSRDGIGVRGLTSAFLISGAGSVVGSLWPVEASSTADLMIRFHRSFALHRMPAAKALREAQLSFLKAFPEQAHPYYWSGFVVTGNFSALR